MTEPATETTNAADKAIVKPADAPLAVMPAHSLMETINKAIESGRTGAELKEFLDLAERMEARLNRRAYDEAFATFQEECPAVTKGREADFITKGGARVRYWYSPLDDIDAVVLPVLNKHGFTRTFGNATLDESGRFLTVTCILSHVGGHREERAFSVPTETSAGMSPQQKFGNADTYAKRRAFINVAGLKGCEVDNDAADDQPAEPITGEQAKTIQDLIVQSEADRVRFLKLFGVKQVSEIPGNRFEEACAKLNQKIAVNRRKT